MGGNYEEFNAKIEKAVISYMSSLPIVTKENTQLGGASPIVAADSPTHSFEQIVEEEISDDSPLQISIDSESMQVDTTKVTVDSTKDPFKDHELAIVGKMVDYSSSTDEDKEEEVKEIGEERRISGYKGY